MAGKYLPDIQVVNCGRDDFRCHAFLLKKSVFLKIRECPHNAF
jgi:hypothetical protein